MQTPNTNHSPAQPICFYFGTTGEFSIPPLEALLADGLTVCGVVMPAAGGLASAAPIIRRRPASVARSHIPMLTPFMNRTIAQIAWERDIPVIEVGRLSSPETLETLAALRPDAICVACFPQRLPRAVLAMPPLGCLNVHPSLLPAYRGPSPGYWVLRNGERQTGVTIHLMDERLDTGDILAQRAFAVPPGITPDALEQQCAVLGGPLLAQAVRALAAGTAVRTPQDPARASYYSWPAEDD
jgi:methionyl-tRNA formyltransferase